MMGYYMKSIKNHLSLIIPLFVMLFSYEFLTLVDRIVSSYEQKLVSQYSIVFSASQKVDKLYLKDKFLYIKSIDIIPNDRILNKLNQKLSKALISDLQTKLPFFYSVKIKTFLNSNELLEFQEKLNKEPSIQRVEVFAKKFDQMREFLILSKKTVWILNIFIFIVTFLLIFKQMEVWTLVHKERIDIMSLLGAPFWLKSATLYKSIIVDSILSAIFASVCTYVIVSSDSFKEVLSKTSLDVPHIDFAQDTLVLTFIGSIVSIVLVTLLIFKQKD